MATEKRLEDQFVENVSRYPFYLITVLLGGLWALLIKPINDLYQRNRFVAVAVVAAVVGLFGLLYVTLKAMLGQPVL
ncbi:MAG: DUF751 family protein [Synechococcaceae cyanobacterium SM2_3_60]|nr:DUF751 family protein [Synechococcaceae cyanobacterium SM2_3_60]